MLLEVEQLDWLLDYIDEKNCDRTCLYLISCSRYLPEPDDTRVLDITYKIYLKVGKLSEALRIAIKLKKYDLCLETVRSEKDLKTQKQFAYILAQSVSLSLIVRFPPKLTFLCCTAQILRTLRSFSCLC